MRATPEDYDGMTVPEIAKALGMPRQSVTRILKRALRKFREGLASKGFKVSDFYEEAAE